jgi:hypothetical protein
LITGEGKCVGGSASTNPFSLTAPYTDYFLTNEPMKNGGSSMVCWNPKDGVSVNCGNGEWSCKVISINEIRTILNISNGKLLNILNK